MKSYKKLLFISGLCLTNFHVLSATETENVNNTEGWCNWLSGCPTYAQLRVGAGVASDFSYSLEEDEIEGRPSKRRVTHQQVGLEIGKIVDEWRFGVEVGYFHGNVKRWNDEEGHDGLDFSMHCTLHGITLLGNVYYNIPLTETQEWSLVLGAGLGVEYMWASFGMNQIPINDITTKHHSCVLPVCQGYVGLAYDINENATINLGYRLRTYLKKLKWKSVVASNEGGEEEEALHSGWKKHPYIHTFECSFMWRFE